MKKRDTVYTRTVTSGKKGVNVKRERYELIHDTILAVLSEKSEIPFRDLPGAVRKKLTKPFDGSISWYTTTVKLDMERKGIIERIPDRKPQHLRLKARVS
jgi:hypothetical protein